MSRKRKQERKIKGLFIEIQRMWNVKYMIIPVITGATGVVTKNLKKSLKAVTGNLLTHSLQKTTTGLLRMSHNTGSTAVCNLKSDRRETTVVSRGRVPATKAFDKRQQNNNMYGKFVTTAGMDFMNEMELEYLEDENWNCIT